MTDMPPSSPEAALRALGARPTPLRPPGPVGELTDRILVHASAGRDAGDRRRLLYLLPAQASGLALRGPKAGAQVRQLREEGFDGVLLIDTESYERAAATAEAPFVLPQDQDELVPVTLGQILQGQLDCGATAALTPTGYLRAGDSDALKSAANAAAALGRDDVMLSVPIDIAWLTEDNIGPLIAVLARLAMPKAVYLGGQFDPLERYRAAVANLRRLVAEAGHVAVLRTDLTGFDVLAHGAFAASIGTGGSLRHIVPFGERPQAVDTKDKSPSVLFSDLMAFFRGSKLAKRFANARPPMCSCSACDGRRLDTFVGRRDAAAAHAHGVRVWGEWLADMLEQPTLADRAAWWRNRCAAAEASHQIVSAQIGQAGAFEPARPLKAWAALPAWPSPAGPPPPLRPP
jgi:hypothetical protein